MNNYENYYWGMNLLWWFLWIGLLAWIFFLPFEIPGQRYKKPGPSDILKMRFARGEISRDEYEKALSVLEGH